MPISKDESFELAPTQFIRGAKMRKSFRVHQRINPKQLPPAAVLFMKSLEKNKASKFETLRIKPKLLSKIMIVAKEEDSESLNDSFDPLVDEEQPLISKTPILKRRSSLKKVKGKKHRVNAIFGFFWRI
jgi:hypothetical protein